VALRDLTSYVNDTSIVMRDYGANVFGALFSPQMDQASRLQFVANLPSAVADSLGVFAEDAANYVRPIDEHGLVENFGKGLILMARAGRRHRRPRCCGQLERGSLLVQGLPTFLGAPKRLLHPAHI
jgi:hypothetical protein